MKTPPATSAQCQKTANPSAPSPAIKASAPSAAARTTRPSSAPDTADSPPIPTIRFEAKAIHRIPIIRRSSSPSPAWSPKKPAQRAIFTIGYRAVSAKSSASGANRQAAPTPRSRPPSGVRPTPHQLLVRSSFAARSSRAAIQHRNFRTASTTIHRRERANRPRHDRSRVPEQLSHASANSPGSLAAPRRNEAFSTRRRKPRSSANRRASLAPMPPAPSAPASAAVMGDDHRIRRQTVHGFLARDRYAHQFPFAPATPSSFFITRPGLPATEIELPQP